MSNELNISKVLSGLELPPNTPGEWFIPRGNVTGNNVSFYNAVPTSIRDTDQQVEIYEVFTLRKGADHGPAAGELQTRLRIRNLSLSEAVVFDVYQAETDN